MIGLFHPWISHLLRSPLLNRTFLKPIFTFLDGVAEGELFIAKTEDGLRPFGQLWVDSARMQLFWLPQDIITMKNISATSDGSRAITARVPFFSTNSVTGKTIQGYGWLGASLDGLRLENYEIHADSGSEMVYVWIPMQIRCRYQNLSGGTFNLFGVGFENRLMESVTVQDTTVDVGDQGSPHWYIATNLTHSLDCVTGQRMFHFLFRIPPTVLKATHTENQANRFCRDHITENSLLMGVFRSEREFYIPEKLLHHRRLPCPAYGCADRSESNPAYHQPPCKDDRL